MLYFNLSDGDECMYAFCQKMKHEGELVTWLTASLWCVFDETSILNSPIILDKNVTVFLDAMFRSQ